MHILIVEPNKELGATWAAHLERLGATVTMAHEPDAAVERISAAPYDAIIISLMLPGGSALAVADFAEFRRPSARLVFVTSSNFFSDGSIFQICANARAFLQSDIRPDDLAAIVQYHAEAH